MKLRHRYYIRAIKDSNGVFETSQNYLGPDSCSRDILGHRDDWLYGSYKIPVDYHIRHTTTAENMQDDC